MSDDKTKRTPIDRRVGVTARQTYDDIAEMFERISVEHQKVSALLKKRDDPKHHDSNLILADAETAHAEACKRAAKALRGRSTRVKHPLYA